MCKKGNALLCHSKHFDHCGIPKDNWYDLVTRWLTIETATTRSENNANHWGKIRAAFRRLLLPNKSNILKRALEAGSPTDAHELRARLVAISWSGFYEHWRNRTRCRITCSVLYSTPKRVRDRNLKLYNYATYKDHLEAQMNGFLAPC